jgi:hypothetical protein
VSGPTNPGSPPPEVPEEFAAAYKAAYERALAAQTVGPQHRDDPEPPDESVDEVDEYDDPAEQPLPRRRGPLRVGTHRTTEETEEYEDDGATWFEGVRDSTWFVPLLLALLALLLILGAYAVGRELAGRVDQSPGTDGLVVDSPDGEIQPFTNQKPGEGAWKGKVTRVEDVRAKARCTSKSGVEADGEPVSYEAGNLTDGVADTTWRCDGKAIGVRITLKLGEKMPIGQVGLVPGYAKTDETDNTDRFAENNRVRRVRWTIGDTKVVQRMSGSPDDRNLQLVRVPRTRTDTVELEILAVKKGPRNKTAISEIQIGRAG